MNGIGKKQGSNSMSSSMDTPGNTSSTTTHVSEEIATTSEYIPPKGLDERIITAPNFSQTSDESGSISHVADVASTDKLSGPRSSLEKHFLELKLLHRKHHSEFSNPSTGTVSAINAPNSEQRNFLCEIRSAIDDENWRTFSDIIFEVAHINTHYSHLDYSATDRGIEKIWKLGNKLQSITTLNNFFSLFLQENKPDLVKLFLKLGANANFTDPEYNCISTIGYATCNKNFEMVELLLEHGACVDGNLNEPTYPDRKDFNFSVYTLHNGVDINHFHGFSPLCTAANLGLSSIVELLLKHGAKGIDNEDISFWWKSPLSCAAFSGHITCVTLLLSKGYKVDGTNKEGQRDPLAFAEGQHAPLACALENNHIKCADLLLANNANVVGSPQLTNYLRFTIHYGHVGSHCSKSNDPTQRLYYEEINIAAVKLLLHYGADSNAEHPRNGSLLLMAIHKKDVLCVNLLLQYGAVSDPAKGTSPLKAALSQRSKENKEDKEDKEDIKIISIVRLLILAGAKLDSSDTDIYSKLLNDNGYHYNPPFRLQSLCLQKLASFLNKGSPEKNTRVVNGFKLPALINKEFYNKDKSSFFEYSP